MAINVNIEGGLVQLSGNPVEIVCSGAAAPVDSTEYKIMLRTISEDGKLFGAPFVDAKAPDENGNRTFDISGYVNQPFKKEFQFPIDGFMTSYPSQAYNIQVQAGERWIDANNNLHEEWGVVNPGLIQMLKGGTNPRLISTMKETGSSFFNLFIQGGEFLTTRPNGDIVHPTQNVKLWYMVDLPKPDVTLTTKVFYLNGTTAEHTTEPFDMNQDSLYEFNCNPTVHGMDLEPEGTKAEHFFTWLNFGAETSVKRYFYFDLEYVERPTFLFFANSVGGIDDVYFSGNVFDKFTTEGELVEFPYQTSDSVMTPTLIPTNKIGQEHWTIYSGWMKLTIMQQYRDLMLATQMWYLYNSTFGGGERIVPVYVGNGEKVLFDRKENMYSLELEIFDAHRSPYVFANRYY